jgi:phage tail P2-like protein
MWWLIVSTFETILPSNATPLELALERVTAFPDLSIDALASLTDPRKIDARFLPWLAFRFAVDFWNDEWSEEKKRDVIAQQFDLHRLKGTEAGIAGMLEIVDSHLRQTLTFPQRAFASASITKEQRNAWLARMPQIRIYFATEKGVIGADAFAGSDGRKDGAFAGAAFARFDAAAGIYGRRAVLRNPDGTEVSLLRSTLETTIETRTAVEIDRLHIPGDSGPASFVGRFYGHGFMTTKNKPASVVTFSLDRTYDAARSTLHLDTVHPGLDPVDVKYERYADRLARGPALFCGDFPRQRFVMADAAANHIYDRVFLHDKTVDVPWVKAHSFADHTRLGITPFKAELLVEARSKRVRRGGYAGLGICGRSFAISENLTKTKLAYAAIRRSKAARDRLKVETQTTRPLTFGDSFKFGDGKKFGSKVRNRLR